MNRLARCFAQLQGDGRTALVPYIAAADPGLEDTVELMHILVENGADILELGVPFSDPMADGPVIQAAFERALSHGVTLKDVLGMVEEFRRRDTETPVVLMGYLNPLELFGVREFAIHAAGVGVDGMIVVDLPPEEARLMGVGENFDRAGIAPVFLLSPTTLEQRIQRICADARGFVYYVSLKGVTGAGYFNDTDAATQVRLIRHHTELPIAVGFGIKDAVAATAVAGFADAVVVGSALVDVIAQGAASGDCFEAAAAFLYPIRVAMDESVGLGQPVA